VVGETPKRRNAKTEKRSKGDVNASNGERGFRRSGVSVFRRFGVLAFLGVSALVRLGVPAFILCRCTA
jgi:hypothetical protein